MVVVMGCESELASVAKMDAINGEFEQHYKLLLGPEDIFFARDSVRVTIKMMRTAIGRGRI